MGPSVKEFMWKQPVAVRFPFFFFLFYSFLLPLFLVCVRLVSICRGHSDVASSVGFVLAYTLTIVSKKPKQ